MVEDQFVRKNFLRFVIHFMIEFSLGRYGGIYFLIHCVSLLKCSILYFYILKGVKGMKQTGSSGSTNQVFTGTSVVDTVVA